MKLQLALGLGSSRTHGLGEKYTDIELPLIENIIRAWSTRRLIPDYKDGIAIKADRTEPVGGTSDDGFAVNFRPDGTILIPDGLDARAYELHEQHGRAESKLINPVFDNCPKVLASNVMKKGLDWSDRGASTSNNLYMEAEGDAAIETAFLDSFSFIVWTYLNANSLSVFYRTNQGSGTWGIRAYAISTSSLRCRLSSIEDKIFTPAAGNTYANKWASIALVVNRAPETPTYTVYLNGINIGTDNLAAPSASSNIPLRIGGGMTSNAPAVNDLVIWNTALSDLQMQAAHDAMAPYYA